MKPNTHRIVIPSILLGIFIGLGIAWCIFNAKYVVTPFGDVVPRSEVRRL